MLPAFHDGNHIPSLQGKTSFFKKTLQTLSCILVKLCIIQHGGRGSRTSKHTLHGRIGCQPDIPALFNFVRLKPSALHCLANGFSIRQSPFVRCLCKCQHLIQIDHTFTPINLHIYTACLLCYRNIRLHLCLFLLYDKFRGLYILTEYAFLFSNIVIQ